MEYALTADDLKTADDAFGQIKRYMELPADMNNTNDSLDMSHVLLICVLREYKQLREGYEKYTGLAAWACRNLLELNVFTKWILVSDVNTKRFMADVAVDGTEMFESMKKWMEHTDPSAVSAPMNETIRLGHIRRSQEGTTGKKHLKVKELADAVGMTDDYVHTNTLCSKLVHPTAWSVINIDDEGEGEYAAIRPLLFHSGVRYGIEAYSTIREHFPAP
jgi:hypothetical protein